ncbi:MAG: hypothetical protein IJK13_00585 [Lachnospiraceae bacterium]|nr:hypothetical protein [Lachnospiraceae bacterium]MBR0434487.1 hypothetical protein [Lachnospiraceae bacterium]
MKKEPEKEKITVLRYGADNSKPINQECAENNGYCCASGHCCQKPDTDLG